MAAKNPRWPPRNLVFLTFQHQTAVISRASSRSPCFYRSSLDRLSLARYQFNERVLISSIINTNMSVCLFVHPFLGHSETNLDTPRHKVAFCSWKVSKTTIFWKAKKLESASQNVLKLLLPLTDTAKLLLILIKFKLSPC